MRFAIGGWVENRLPKVHSQERLNDEQMRRRGGGLHRHAARVGVELLQGAGQRVRIAGKVRAGRIGLIFARARDRQAESGWPRWERRSA